MGKHRGWPPSVEQAKDPRKKPNGASEERLADVKQVNGTCRFLRMEPVTEPEFIPTGENKFEEIEEPDQSKL